MIKPTKTQDVFLQIRLSRELRDKFNEICDENAVNRSELFRKWIERYVKDHEK